MRKHFRDSRPEWKFYADEVFMFHTGGYAQSWAALRDFERLACAVGLKGLVILFAVSEAYAKRYPEARVDAFIEDMRAAYHFADLVIPPSFIRAGKDRNNHS